MARQKSQIVSNIPPMPLGLRAILGEKFSDDIIEDTTYRMAVPVPRKRGIFRRVLSTISLRPNPVEPARGANQERTFRGPSYQSPTPEVGEWKPLDWLTADVVDQMKKNGVIKTALFIKKAPILGVMSKFEIKHENPQIQAYLNFVMKDIMFDLVKTSLYAMDYGVALHEKVFKFEKVSFKYEQNGQTRSYKKDSVHYKKIKWNHPKTIKRINIQDNTQDFDGYAQVKGLETVDIPLQKSFMWGKDQSNSLWGTSELDAVYEYWYWLEILSGYFMRYLEKLGTPPMVGYAPPGTTYSREENSSVENLTWLAGLAGRFQDGMAVVMPSQFDPNSRNRLWELKEMALSNRGDLYKMAIEWLENSIFKGLFVPDKPVSSHGSGQHGSYALADVQFEAFLIGLDWDLSDLGNGIEKYVIRPLLDFNFGIDVADAELIYPPLSREFKQRLYDVFYNLVANHPDFDAIDFQEIASQLGIPLYSPEEILEKQKEKVEQAKAMMEATTPPQPAAAPAKSASVVEPPQTFEFQTIVNPPVPPDLSKIEEQMDSIEERIEELSQQPEPTETKPKVVRKIVERDDHGRITSVTETEEE